MALIDFSIKPGIDKQDTEVGAKTVGLILITQDLDMDYLKK